MWNLKPYNIRPFKEQMCIRDRCTLCSEKFTLLYDHILLQLMCYYTCNNLVGYVDIFDYYNIIHILVFKMLLSLKWALTHRFA